MEVTSRVIHYSQNIPVPYKFRCTTMNLKLQTLLAPNVGYTMLVFFILCSEIYLQNFSKFIVDKLFTEHFSEHHHAFKVQRYCELGELVKANRLKFYRPFDLQCLYGSDDGEYIVPSFVLV